MRAHNLASGARRRIVTATLALLAGATTSLGALAADAPKTVRVVTAYPDEVVSRFEAAFERAHPEWRLHIVWRMANDALPYLMQPGANGVDVYWAASPRTYAALAAANRFQPLKLDLAGLPQSIGGTRLADARDLTHASELAAYGIAVSPAALAARGLPTPADWADLADPRYAGQIAMPSPARVGFAPPLLEIVLQAFGWERGWALWSEIAGNSVPVDSGATFVSDEVASGRFAVGLSIDFFVASAIARGAALAFVHPDANGVNPAQIAVLADAPQPEGARVFARFVLSEAGQALLADPAIRKLPVRPSVYARLPAGYWNPFAAAARGGLAYDGERAAPRLGLSTTLFDRSFIVDHAEHAALWRRLHAAEARGVRVPEARAALSAAPLSEAEAATLQVQFGRRLEGETPHAGELERRFRAAAAERRARAAQALDKAGA